MEKLTLKPRLAVEDEVECWDDDGDLCVDEIQLSSSATNAFVRPAAPHRDSISSRLSMRSDLESTGGGDEERQVLLPGDDDRSTAAAIASAVSAGIPIPQNVPSSALLGGTIKRLGGKKSRPVLGDDWGEDLELPGLEAGGLKIKKRNDSDFPDVLRDVGESSILPHSPKRHDGSMSFADRMKLHKAEAAGKTSLDKFRDQDGDDEDDFGDVPTIRVGKERSPPKPIPFSSTTVFPSNKDNVDDFEDDLELPEDGAPLKLSTRKEIPRTPAQLQDEFDEWTEGSLGTRHGGTRRGGRSPRSSSISAMSPSVSSSFTIESEDEGLDGLILPEGPLNFDDVLKKRQQAAISPETVDVPSGKGQSKEDSAVKEDFFTGIEIGDGDVFDSAKLTLNKNIKHKLNRSTSPVRRTAMTLTFTNKPLSTTATSRIPRPMGATDRMTSTLEPVSEVGGPVANNRRTQSRLGGHSAQTSVSSIPLPSTPSSRSTVPSTPTRHRDLRTKASMGNLKSAEPSTSNAQLLKSKRSMPVMRPSHVIPSRGPASSGYQRPPSRAEGGGGGRSSFPSRPKTPIDRSGAESSLGHARKPPIPFLPAGTSYSQSHHVSSKPSSQRNIRRHDSESSLASGGGDGSTRSGSRVRAPSRFTHRSPSPRRRELVASESLAREAATKRTLVQPAKRRYFGNGTELEVFDDLPSSASQENRFLKAPIGRGAPKAIRSKLGLPQIDDRPEPPSTPVFSTPMPMSPSKEFTPRFARDTAASRLREQRGVGIPMTPMSTNWKTSMALRGQVPGMGMGMGMNSGSGSSSIATTRVKRGHKNGGAQKKPHLIKPLGDTHNNAKSVKGMHYNPTLYRWEGNENALAPFDIPLLVAAGRHPSPARGGSNRAAPPSTANAKTDSCQRPALITNITTATPSIQVVGGMVFDPQRMCWLKLKHQQQHHASQKSPSLSRDDLNDDTANDSDDPFAGLDDLDDNIVKSPTTTSKPTQGGTSAAQQDPQQPQQKQSSKTSPGSSPPSEKETRDEWLVGEEFDVGPEFIRRQREEEVRWRRKVESWTGSVRRRAAETDDQAWRWDIRDVIVNAGGVSARSSGGGRF